MIDVIIFTISAIAALIAAAAMFMAKDILHSATALAAVFLINSMLFLLLGQPLLAVVQLFIMIGGIATFLFVGVASHTYSDFRPSNVQKLSIVWTVVFLMLLIPLNSVQMQQTQPNTFGFANIAYSLTVNPAIFYLMLLTMFGIALGAIMLLRRSSE